MAWVTWSDLKRKCEGSRVYFYGRSEDWIPKTDVHVKAEAIIDGNASLHGTHYRGLPVVSIKNCSFNDENALIIITSGDYENILCRLIEEGVAREKIFFCPEYYDFNQLVELRNSSFEIILSSSDYKSGKATRTSKFGGGIFSLEVEEGVPRLVKRLDGQYRQLVKMQSSILAVEYNAMRVDVLSDFETVAVKKKAKIVLPRVHFCGLAVDEKSGIIFVANASEDVIYKYDLSGNFVGKVKFGPLSGSSGESRYHINDLFFDEETLFVSYFSKSGFWKNDVFDGGVAALIEDEFHELIGGLWQPHTPVIESGKLYVLDSFRGRLLSRSEEVIGEFPGFIRGLKFSAGRCFVGQSETMYMSRKAGLSNNIMVNSGVWYFDQQSKASRFYDTHGICNIHSIV